MRHRSPLVLWRPYLWFNANPITNANDWLLSIFSCVWIYESNNFNVYVSHPIGTSFLLPFNLKRKRNIVTNVLIFPAAQTHYLKIQIVKAIAIKLDYVTDIAFAEIVIATATTDMHPNGYMIANVCSVIVVAGQIRLAQVRRYRLHACRCS